MNITLTWDLFIVVFVAMILAYSFIIGRKQTMKIIIASYIAFLAADGLGYFLKNTVSFAIPAKMFGVDPANAAIMTSLILYVVFIVILSRHHTFDVNVEDNGADLAYFITTSFAAFMCAVLMVSSAMHFISGNSLTAISDNSSNGMLEMFASYSEIAENLVDYFYVSFFLPALTLVGISMFDKRGS